jgi:hypothetical protein
MRTNPAFGEDASLVQTRLSVESSFGRTNPAFNYAMVRLLRTYLVEILVRYR